MKWMMEMFQKDEMMRRFVSRRSDWNFVNDQRALNEVYAKIFR